jgi:hypothetical protein
MTGMQNISPKHRKCLADAKNVLVSEKLVAPRRHHRLGSLLALLILKRVEHLIYGQLV